jgi:hypothetical protein
MFLDAYHGIDPWIKKAVAGDFTEKDLPAYRSWASTVAPAGSGQPGAGTAHNLNAFGQNFLLNMAKPWKDEPSRLQYLHDLMSDPNMTGRQIRREFSKFGEGTGIDNKVVSFTQLVAGHPDVMVLDRVQMRALWDDGRFADRNIYDGVRDAEGKIITGTALANLTYGTRGLLQYEAIENALANRIKDIYTAVGRPQDASIGRYHWESWVAHSQQEASHGTLGSILDKSIAKVTSKQGEYGAYEYGTRYGRDENGHPFFVYRTPSGQDYSFNVPAFRSFLEEIKKPATGVVPTKFKVTESGNAPWYERPEVNKERLDAIAHKWADRPANGGRQLSALAAEQQNAGGVGGHGLPAAPGYQGLDPPYARGGAVNYTLRPVAYNPFKDDAKLSHAPRRAEHAKGGAVKRDEGGEVVDYDYDAAKAAGVTPDERGHMPDTYKLPNHMTFSDESVYHGQNGEQGGRWDSLGGDRWAFTPGTTNLRYHSIPEMQQYFQRVEPDSLLVLPNAGVTGMARGGRAKLAHVSVGYVARSTHLPQKCGGCTMFMPPSGCTLVQSPIKAGGWCRRFNAKAE